MVEVKCFKNNTSTLSILSVVTTVRQTAQDPGRGPEQFVTVSASAGMCLRAGGVEGVRLCTSSCKEEPNAEAQHLGCPRQHEGSLSGASTGRHGPQRQHESSLGFWKASRWKEDPPTHQQAGRNVCTPRSGSICGTQ